MIILIYAGLLLSGQMLLCHFMRQLDVNWQLVTIELAQWWLYKIIVFGATLVFCTLLSAILSLAPTSCFKHSINSRSHTCTWCTFTNFQCLHPLLNSSLVISSSRSTVLYNNPIIHYNGTTYAVSSHLQSLHLLLPLPICMFNSPQNSSTIPFPS